MRASFKRILSAVAFGTVCAVAGAYVGIDRVYTSLHGQLPALIGQAGCTP